MMQEFARRRKLVLGMIKQIPGFELETIPNGAFYVFPKVSLSRASSGKLADYLLKLELQQWMGPALAAEARAICEYHTPSLMKIVRRD